MILTGRGSARHREHERLLRQYSPKGTDLNRISRDHLDFVAAQLNGRPAKSLIGTRLLRCIMVLSLHRPLETARSVTRSIDSGERRRGQAALTPGTTSSDGFSSDGGRNGSAYRAR